jgi:hypothetical protein
MDRRRKQTQFSRGRWQLERERCQIEDREPPVPFSEPTPLASVIPDLIRSLEPARNSWADPLEEEWAALVGPPFGAHTRPGRLDGGRLVVFVDNPVWLSELSRYGRGKLLSRLQTRFGADKIASVSFQLDPEGS